MRCRSPSEAISLVSRHTYYFSDSVVIPRWLAECLIKLKFALLFNATTNFDITYSNFGISCGAVWCTVPRSLIEILQYMSLRLEKLNTGG